MHRRSKPGGKPKPVCGDFPDLPCHCFQKPVGFRQKLLSRRLAQWNSLYAIGHHSGGLRVQKMLQAVLFCHSRRLAEHSVSHGMMCAFSFRISLYRENISFLKETEIPESVFTKRAPSFRLASLVSLGIFPASITASRPATAFRSPSAAYSQARRTAKNSL